MTRGRKAGWLQCPHGRDREEPAGLRLIPGRWGLLGWVLSNPVLPRLPQSFDLSPVCPVRPQLGHPVPTAGSSTPTSACALPTSPEVPGGLSGGCGTFQSPQFWPLAACGLSRQGVGPCPAVPWLLEGQDGHSAAVASSRPPWLCCSRRDGLPPAPGAPGEGVASPEPTLSVDSDAEWEKKQLLEGEGRAQREGKSLPSPLRAAWWLVGGALRRGWTRKTAQGVWEGEAPTRLPSRFSARHAWNGSLGFGISGISGSGTGSSLSHSWGNVKFPHEGREVTARGSHWGFLGLI